MATNSATMERTTFLITYYANKPLLDLCLASIKKFHPEASIIISQDTKDDTDLSGYKVIRHTMGNWGEVCEGLMRACETDIGIFIEHDCFLLKSLNDLVAKIGEYDLVGIEDNIPGLRHSPGFAAQSFLIFDVKKFKELGVENLYVRKDEKLFGCQNTEAAYGISQTLDKKFYLPVKKSGYGHGTFYGDYVHHFWYGSFPKRNVSGDNVSAEWLAKEQERLLNNYKI